MRMRNLYLVKLGMEVQVTELSSDSEGEASARSPDRKPPAPVPAQGPDRGDGCPGTEGRGTDNLSEQGSAAASLQQLRDAVKKGKEKVIEGGSAWAAGPPKLGGGSRDARDCAMDVDGDPWSAQVRKAGDAGNGSAAGCWGDWGDQMPSERKGFQGTNGQQRQVYNAWDDHWKGILGAGPADPVNTPWRPWDTGMRGDEADMSAQGSQATREVSGCDDILMEDSNSSWLSRVEGLHFPIPDEHQLRSRQIQLDEEFARELQEQLDQGLQRSQQSESVDTAIAWTLQDAERARIAAREGQSSSSQSQRDRSMAHLYSYGRHAPAQNSTSWANHTPSPMLGRRGFRSSDSLEVQQQNMLISQLARGVFTDDMDLETGGRSNPRPGTSRLAVLDSIKEALDSFGDPYPPESDFDYENMIVRDGDNHHKGASDDQINNLPTSVVEVENPDDLCAICWDCPAAGDSLRCLPCLHKFHTECIDKWLRMKISCPVCKSNII